LKGQAAKDAELSQMSQGFLSQGRRNQSKKQKTDIFSLTVATVDGGPNQMTGMSLADI
jgi:hypothetical protein